LSRPIRFCAGTGSSSPGNGRTRSVGRDAPPCSLRFDAWSCGWRPTIRTWGYTRIQGALKNIGHRAARSTIATILKQQGIPPSGERPTSWHTFLRAHWGALLAADLFTTEVWTFRGLVTYYSVFVIELHSRRVHIVGSTPHPNEPFMFQIARHLTDAANGVLHEGRVLICDRDGSGAPVFGT
jgi:putative transposase